MATRIARTRITAGRAPSHPEVCFVAVRDLFDEPETACGEHFSRRSGTSGCRQQSGSGWPPDAFLVGVGLAAIG